VIYYNKCVIYNHPHPLWHGRGFAQKVKLEEWRMYWSLNYVSITKGIMTISATMTSNVTTMAPNSNLANRSEGVNGNENVTT